MRPFRNEIMLAVFFCLLSAVALLPILFVHLGTYQGGFLSRLEQFVSAYDGLLASLGTLFLILGMGVWTTYLSNKSAAARQRADRITSAELKISEFRQAWIDKLRQDLADVVFLTSVNGTSEDSSANVQRVEKLKKLDSLVRLRLNPGETKAQELAGAVRKVIDLSEMVSNGCNDKFSDMLAARESLAKLSAEYLKVEWEVVKHVLQKAKEDET